MRQSSNINDHQSPYASQKLDAASAPTTREGIRRQRSWRVSLSNPNVQVMNSITTSTMKLTQISSVKMKLQSVSLKVRTSNDQHPPMTTLYKYHNILPPNRQEPLSSQRTSCRKDVRFDISSSGSTGKLEMCRERNRMSPHCGLRRTVLEATSHQTQSPRQVQAPTRRDSYFLCLSNELVYKSSLRCGHQ